MQESNINVAPYFFMKGYAMSKSNKKEPKIESVDNKIVFSELISKIIVTSETPMGLLSEWEKEYDIRNCQVLMK